MAVRHLITKGFPSVPFLVTQGLGDYGGVTPPTATTLPDAYGAGRDWRALGDAEFLIHKIGTAVSKKYKRKLSKVLKEIEEEPEELPPELLEFLENEALATHIAALDLIESKVSQQLEELIKAWLHKQLIEDDEEVVMLLLH